MAPALVSLVFDLLAIRRRETIAHGWAEAPEWIFPSQTGGLWDPDNHDEAISHLRQMCVLAEALFEDDSSNNRSVSDLTKAYNFLGRFLAVAKLRDEASELRGRYLRFAHRLGDIGHHEQAVVMYQFAIQMMESLLAHRPMDEALERDLENAKDALRGLREGPGVE